MDKLQKYYISLLLVVVYTNMATQVSCIAEMGADSTITCEIFDSIVSTCSLKANDSTKESEYKTFTSASSKSFICVSESRIKHTNVLRNFERKYSVSCFEDAFDFKTKVSKIRNKDYLESQLFG